MLCGQTLSQLKTKFRKFTINLMNRLELSMSVIKKELNCKPNCLFCYYFDLCWYDYIHMFEEVIGEPVESFLDPQRK